MATRTHTNHHCYNLGDIKPLIEQMGYRVDLEECYETEEMAYARSLEKHWGNVPVASVVLNKQTEKLIIADRSK